MTPPRPAPDGPEDLAAGLQTVTATIQAARHRDNGDDGPETGSGVPTTVLTGFLGAGKTTILRRLLTADHGLRVAAIVNDLGSLNVDAELIGSTPGGGLRWDVGNGCACCTLSDDLARSLADAATSEPRPDAVVIEASGAADPVALAAVVEGSAAVALDGIVAVVDGHAWSSQLAHPTLGGLVRRQLEAAHLVVLSKVDGMASPLVAEIQGAIGDLAPGRPVVPVAGGVVDPSIVLGSSLRGAALRPEPSDHEIAVETSTVDLPGPVDLDRLTAWLEGGTHGLIRAKGWIEDQTGSTHLLQVVGRRWTLSTRVRPGPSAVVLMADDRAVLAAGERALHSLVTGQERRGRH